MERAMLLLPGVVRQAGHVGAAVDLLGHAVRDLTGSVRLWHLWNTADSNLLVDDFKRRNSPAGPLTSETRNEFSNLRRADIVWPEAEKEAAKPCVLCDLSCPFLPAACSGALADPSKDGAYKSGASKVDTVDCVSI